MFVPNVVSICPIDVEIFHWVTENFDLLVVLKSGDH